MHQEKLITDTLIQYTVEHKHGNERCIQILRECSEALANEDKALAYDISCKFKNSCGIGRMGCFDDTTLQVVYEHESLDYVDVIFRALLTKWSIVMNHLEP